MAFWWVNHKQTRKHEVLGGYLWSPFRNANGAFNQTYENMRMAREGDIVFSFANGEIQAIGRVTEEATSSPKPVEFGSVGDYWSDEGWLVGVEFAPVPRSIRPAGYANQLAPLLPDKNSPIRANGHGNQGCYLASIPDSLGLLLLALTEAEELAATNRLLTREAELGGEVLEDIHRIEADQSIPETQRMQLSKARIGQGLFRKRVILLEQSCRVTGVDDRRVLVASHIKPWKDASNAERLSGLNGLLLSPHVDALFDDRLITFEQSGRMRVHPSLSREVLERWSIDPDRRVAPFRPEQSGYLEHHHKLFLEKVS